MKPICLVFCTVVFLVACSSPPPPQAEPEPTFRPVGSVLQLMEAVIIPSSNVVWNVPAEAPENDEEWATVRNNALALAEAGNLLMIGERAKDQDAWIKASQELVDAGTAAFRAAEARDVDAIAMAGDTIYNACESCHMQYPPDTAEGQ